MNESAGGATGAPVGAATMVEDALRSAEWRLKSIIEGTNVGSWEWNVQTGETRFNERWAEIIGYRLEELEPVSIQTWIDFANPEDLQGSDQLLERHFSGELEYYDIECRMRHRDGHWVWVHDRGRVFSWTPDGKPEWMFGTHQDITARKRAEEQRVMLERQLLHAQKLESLGILAGGIAHDFNNILGGIRGYTDLALLEVAEDSELRECLLEVVDGVERASRLTKQMLAYSGQSKVVVVPVDVNGIVRATVDLLRGSLGPEATLEVRLDETLPSVDGDPGELQQVVANLLTNAGDALRDGSGTIAVRTGTMSWDGRTTPVGFTLLSDGLPRPEPGEYVFLEVTDDGEGMDPQVQRRFCEPFFSTRFQGRGLGMSAVQGILRAHGGSLLLSSVPDEGTTIRAFVRAPSGIDPVGPGGPGVP